MTVNSGRFGILHRVGRNELHWVKDGDAVVALGEPGRLAYADRASAEHDLNKMRAKYPEMDLIVVEATPDNKEDRFILLSEGGMWRGATYVGLEQSIWNAVSAFNETEIARGAPPATVDEVIRALATAVDYALTFLGCAGDDEHNDDGVSLRCPDSEDKEVLDARFVKHLMRASSREWSNDDAS
jgi:hypothetical protein